MVGLVVVTLVLGGGLVEAAASTPRGGPVTGCTASGPLVAPGAASCWFVADNAFDIVAVGGGPWWAEVRRGRQVIELGDAPSGFPSYTCFLQGSLGQHEAVCPTSVQAGDRVTLWAGISETVTATPDVGCRQLAVPTPCHP
jgi:hypothetical protein